MRGATRCHTSDMAAPASERVRGVLKIRPPCATTARWTDMKYTAAITGSLGYAVGTFVGLSVGQILRAM